MKYSLLTIILLFTIGCSSYQKFESSDKESIDITLNNWHKAVAASQFETYFNLMTEDAIFVGTDASEVWNKEQFMAFSKPYFEKKQTWDFKPISRNIYRSSQKSFAYFDEVLDTWMGLCRGSGVMKKENDEWKIQHYVLSVIVANEAIKEVIKVKKTSDEVSKSLLMSKKG